MIESMCASGVAFIPATSMGESWKVSTRNLSVEGVRKAGSSGPILMFLTPRCSSESSTSTAFCSSHDSTIVRGSEFTSVFSAAASVLAMTTAENESLH
jgi:hypothetical protein